MNSYYFDNLNIPITEEEEEEWDVRMNHIGQNGNDGLHYSRRECDKCTTPDECPRCIHNREGKHYTAPPPEDLKLHVPYGDAPLKFRSETDPVPDTDVPPEFGTYDTVEKPEHYASGDVECIDAIKAAMTPEEFKGYLKGNVFKYVWRERQKGGEESLRKARWYLTRLTNISE